MLLEYLLLAISGALTIHCLVALQTQPPRGTIYDVPLDLNLTWIQARSI